MRSATIDGCAVTSLEAVHETLAQQLDFPAWYGGNLDALYDCLTALREDVTLTLLHRERLSQALGPGYPRLCRVLRDAAQDNPHLILSL